MDENRADPWRLWIIRLAWLGGIPSQCGNHLLFVELVKALMPSPIAKFVLLAVASILILTACTSAVSPTKASRYKFLVSADGLYRVTSTSLRDVGAKLDRIDATTLQLFHADQEIAIRVLDEGKDFSIEFYGQASDSPYSEFNVYWLTWGETQGKRILERAAAPPAGNPQETFQDRVILSKPTLFIPQLGETNTHWFWQSLAAPTTTTITATLPGATAASAQLRADFWSSTQDLAQPDHHLRLFVNNTQIADQSWDGQGARAIQATIPPNVLRDGDNSIRIVAPGDTRAQADIVLLDSITLTYTRKLSARGNALAFEGGRGTWRVTDFTADAIDLFDITDPQQPTRLIHLTTTGRALGFQNESNDPRRWLAVTPAGRKSVARILPMSSPHLRARDQQADYLIITPPDFVDAIRPLAQWREQHGLKTRIVTDDEIYDEFGFGAESPTAIRDFIDWTVQQWNPPSPRYVLLVGKASYDYRNYLNAPNKNLLPTFLVRTPNLGQAGSDNRFVALDQNSVRPALAIGRIPAKTSEQVALAVKKTIGYESSQPANWRRAAVFVADSKEPQFAESSDRLASKLPTIMHAQKIYLESYKGDLNQARADLIARWNSGASLVTYIGHGSIDTWAEGPLFSSENVRDIKNGERLSILFTPTCLDGFFYHPQKDSLTEALLFKTDGGIVAGLVPTGLSFPFAQDELMDQLYQLLFAPTPPTLGEAMTLAKQKIASERPELQEVIETFVLLGDPALRFAVDK